MVVETGRRKKENERKKERTVNNGIIDLYRSLCTSPSTFSTQGKDYEKESTPFCLRTIKREKREREKRERERGRRWREEEKKEAKWVESVRKR